MLTDLQPRPAECTKVNFFTHVTKTCPNLTTYSRKPENNNGTIIFEIDIMKKSYPVNLKFTFLPLSKPDFFSMYVRTAVSLMVHRVCL